MGHGLRDVVIAVCVLALSCAAAVADSPPSVESVSAANHPAVPAGWKETCLQGPNTLASSPTCPVVKYNGHTYWAWSDVNNGFAMMIVAYDANGKAVKQWNRTGARYVWEILVSQPNETVSFVGQSNDTITMTWTDLLVPSPQPGQLSFVNVKAPDVNCIFEPSCTVTVNDSVGAIPLPSSVTGTARLQSRTFPGAPGSKADGKTAHLYRVDLTQAVSGDEAPCVTDLTVDFGAISQLPYDGTGQPYDIFVITQGGIGTIGLYSAQHTGTAVQLTFNQPVCAGATPGSGHSSQFIGLASTHTPKAVTAHVGWPGMLPLNVPARAPAF